MIRITATGLLALLAVIGLACGSTNPTTTAGPQQPPTALATATLTTSPPTVTPPPTPSLPTLPRSTPTPSATLGPTLTLAPVPTVTIPTPTLTPTLVPEVTPTPVLTVTPMPTSTLAPTPTSTPTPTLRPIPLPSSTPVPPRFIVVSPGEAPPGGEVSVAGEKFTPNSRFTVTHMGFEAAFGTTTDIGSLSANFVVPFTAARGNSNPVVVKDEKGLEATFSLGVSEAAITLSTSQAYAGETISVIGTGFPPRTPLSSITFTKFPSVNLNSESPSPTTDGIGNITVEVQAPWPDRSGAIRLDILGVIAEASLLIRPATITATRQDANTVHVVGEGFEPNSQVGVDVNIRAAVVPNFFSDENGNVAFEITTYETRLDETVSVRVGDFTASARIN